MGVEHSSGGGVLTHSLDASAQIANVQRRIVLEREIRRGMGRASLAQLELIATTIRNFNMPVVTDEERQADADDGVMPGVHFEGGF